MKKLLVISSLLVLISSAGIAQNKMVVKQVKAKVKTDKYHDNIDDRMKGPEGQVIYIGTNGGRYYMSKDKKVYVKYNRNKKK